MQSAGFFRITDLSPVMFLSVCLMNGTGTSCVIVESYLISPKIYNTDVVFQLSRLGEFVSKVSYKPPIYFSIQSSDTAF